MPSLVSFVVERPTSLSWLSQLHDWSTAKLRFVSAWISRHKLRRAIQRRLLSLGFRRNGVGYALAGAPTKEQVRDLHRPGRRAVLASGSSFLGTRAVALLGNFAEGREIDPKAVAPELVEVAPGTEESELYRLATLLWSVPVSAGFGRRLRFLVRDRQNGKLIGVFALGDPVFNLTARDSWVGWSAADRAQRLVHVMDAYVVGAVPPYAQLIGGKLVAALMTSQEVLKAYNKKYLGKISVIEGVRHQARLVLLTTTSALGRSSLYNRLALPDGPRFIQLGVTKGFGHFHLSGRLFELMRRYLQQSGHPYATGNRFGMGPNWKLRVARAALEGIGFDSDGVLRHGIEREVYGIPLARNWKEILAGTQQRVYSLCKPATDIGDFCKERWLVPRSLRDSTYLTVTRASIRQLLISGVPVVNLPSREVAPITRAPQMVGAS